MATKPDPKDPARGIGHGDLDTDTFQIDAARLEGQAVLDLVVAEVSHELAHTLNFLRCLAEGAAASPGLSWQEASLAQREAERLQGVLRHLRRLKLAACTREPVHVLGVVQRALDALADVIAEKQVTISLAVAGQLTLPADSRRLYILVREVLAAMVYRAEPASTIEVHAALPSDAGPARIDVWSNAARATPFQDSDLRDPWTPTPGGTTRFGLAVAYRIARSLDWMLSTLSEPGREGLRITIPRSAFSPEPWQ